jgi:hypothetical protein
MLRQEGVEQAGGVGLLGVLREKGTAAQVAPGADHHQIDAGQPSGRRQADDVDVVLAPAFHELLFAHPVQGLHLVAMESRLLEAQRVGGRLHARADAGEQLVVLALQEHRRADDVGGVIGCADRLHARPATAADLVQQAGPRAVGEHRVLAGAQAEHLLQDVHALAHRVGIGVGPEVAVGLVGRPPVIAQARVGMPGEHDIGVGLVVAEEDVVARRQALDQVVFQDQGLGLGARHVDARVLDARHHQSDARAEVAFLEVTRYPLLQVARLADVEHLARLAEHAVDAGQVGQGRQEGGWVEGRRFRHDARLTENIARDEIRAAPPNETPSGPTKLE